MSDREKLAKAAAQSKAAFRPEKPPGEPTTASLPLWPDPPAEAAYHGLAGDIVRAIDPTTEADPVAILGQLLVAFGNRIGRSAYYLVEDSRHYSNEFLAIVGDSSSARKGTSWGRVERLFQDADTPEGKPVPLAGAPWHCRIASGLSSAEGLIWAVRDPIPSDDDSGEADKRLLVQEPEFANVLKQSERQGNTLSAVIRNSFDKGNLRSMTKNSPARATDAHISIVGHITTEELRRCLNATETANGFANRFIFLAVRRSKMLPDGGRLPQSVRQALSVRLRAAIYFAESVQEMQRTTPARDLWHEVYGPMTTAQPGIVGSLLARSAAHVLRLSMLYALLDHQCVIEHHHLEAALALWAYSERSVRHIFGNSLGDPLADSVLSLIRTCGLNGVSRTDISNYLGRNVKAAELSRVLGILLAAKLAHFSSRDSRGRPAEVWFHGPAK